MLSFKEDKLTAVQMSSKDELNVGKSFYTYFLRIMNEDDVFSKMIIRQAESVFPRSDEISISSF